MGFLDGILGGIGDFISPIFSGVKAVGSFLGDVAEVSQPFTNAVAPYASAAATMESVNATNDTNREIALNANSASAAQADLNRMFQQASADKQMSFQGSQIAGQQAFESGQAQRQMDFQERMSGSTWQRGVQDMKAAGLNPMLAYSQGGASSPVGASGKAGAASGASASGSMGQTSTSVMHPAMAQAINTGMAAARLRGDLSEQGARTELIRAETRKTAEDEATSRATGVMHAENAGHLAALKEKVLDEMLNLQAERKRIDSDTALKRFDAEKLQPLQEKLLDIESRLKAYEVQGASNRSSAAGTWYGRNIQPYLHDILGTGKAVGTGAIGGALLRK